MKRTYTTEEKAAFAAKRGETMDTLAATILEGVEACRNSEAWKRWLKACSYFHGYSFGNVMLIMSQCKAATHVAGFHTWKKVHRSVKKGETGIKILCPRRFISKDDDGTTKAGIAGFSIGYVFDISQTEGEPLPAPPCLARLLGDDNGLRAAVTRAVLHYGCTITTERPDYTPEAARGSYHPKTQMIFVDPLLHPREGASTLIHELSHHLVRTITTKGEIDGATEEVIVESAAYIVCNAHDIDTSSKAFPYIAGWAGTRKAEEIEACLTISQRIARQIIDTMHATAQEMQRAA